MGNYTANYWAKRSDMLYYKAIDQILRVVGFGARSLVDVGSGNSPYVDWWSWIDRKVSIDIRAPYSSPGVEAIVGNILDWKSTEKFDICTCLQVLEHIDDPKPFTQKLFDIGEVVVISVPFNWPEGRTVGHVQDPVDRDKLESWTGRKPNFSTVIAEPFGSVKHERLIAVYHSNQAFRWRPAKMKTRILREMGPVHLSGGPR